MNRRASLSAAAVVLGLILVLVAVTQLHHDRATPTDFAVPPPTHPATSTPATFTPATSTPAARTKQPTHTVAPSHSTRPTDTAAPLNSATPSPTVAPTYADPSGAAPAVPVSLSLPSLDVRATVRQVVTTDGVLGVPDNIDDVGWWTGSVRPGSAAGSTVIDGHVDSAVTGTGALFHLAQLQAGDPVTLTDSAGVLRHYRVYQRQVFVKHDGLPADLFSTTGTPRLVMITCGGPFDSATRNYLDNIVVFAAPV